MFSKILLPSAVFGLFLSASSLSAQVIWDGGASTTNFGDAANWNPSATYTTSDDFETGANTITVGSDFSIGSLEIRNGAGFTINSGNTFTINSLSSMQRTSTLTVDGTLDTNGQRFDFVGNGGSLDIDINGSLLLTNGNNLFTTNADTTFDVNNGGVFQWAGNAFGRTANVAASRAHRANIFTGGTVNLSTDLTLQAATNGGTHTSAFELQGGDLNFGSNDYVYTNLDTANASNGIIFQDAASTITLAGDRVSDVNSWITANAVRSNVGTLQVTFDGSDTLVAVPEPSTGALFLGLAGVCLALIRRRR